MVVVNGEWVGHTFVFVQDAEADGAGGVDVWVEERGDELALWWLCGVFCFALAQYHLLARSCFML